MILDALDRRALRSRADRLGFRNAGNLEKLAADFDAHAAISGAIGRHLRGGPRMPFHVASEAHRISVDIDLHTPSSRERVSRVVPGALEGGRFVSTTAMKSRPAMPLSQLVTLVTRFQSHFGARVAIHIDIACGIDMGMIDTVTVPAGRPVLGFETERPISALSRGSLIADKPPPAIGTVGYGNLENTPKQVYDVGTLIQHSDAGDLESALSAHGALSAFKLAHDSRGHGRDEVAQSIVEYPGGIGRAGAPPEAARHMEDFAVFSQGMPSGRMSGPAGHAERILPCPVPARSVARKPGPGAPRAEEAAGTCGARDRARAVGDADGRLALLRGEPGLGAQRRGEW